MGKRFKILLLFVSLSLSLSLMSNTYSRYIANTVGDLEVIFAKWQILVNDTDITSQETSSISLIPIILENENVKKNTIAPSSKGYFDIVVDPTNVDVSFSYKIDLNYENEDIPDLVVTKYAIINDSTSDFDNLDLISLSGNTINGDVIYNNNIEGFEHSAFTIRVFFEWYDGEDETMNDEADTLIGIKANNDEVSDIHVNASISFAQLID